MTPYTNPYAPPQSNDLYAPPVAPADVAGFVPEAIVEPLRATRPWVIFLAIVGFVFVGLAMFGGVAVILVGLFAGTSKAEPFPMAALGAFYLVFGAVYALPCVGLIRYGTAIGALIREPRMEHLGVALNHQRWFWKVVGIMTAILLAMYPIAIIGVVVAVAAKGIK